MTEREPRRAAGNSEHQGAVPHPTESRSEPEGRSPGKPAAIDAQALKGMAVVTLDEAERLGRVADVVFETKPLKVAALLTKDDGQERYIAFASVTSIGHDAIVTNDVGSAQEPSRRDRELPGLETLRQLKVVDESGNYLGHISRLEVDHRTGEVTAFDVRKGEILGVGGETKTLDPGRVLGIGPELLTVRRSG